MNYCHLLNTPILLAVLFIFNKRRIFWPSDFGTGIFIWHSVVQLEAQKIIDNMYHWPTK